MYNPYLIVPFVTWAVAQTLKFTLAALRGRLDFKYLYASGGMPSVHSAVVCSLAATSLLIDGGRSHLFGLTAIFAAIVMYDSFGVRRASGEQAAAINMLMDSLDSDRVRLKQPRLRLREILGHKPLEVTVGALVGLAMAALFNPDKVGHHLSYLSVAPHPWERLAYLVFFSVLVVGGWLTKIILSRKYGRVATVQRFSNNLMIKTQVIGWTGLLLCLAQYEQAKYLSWRVWPILLIAVMLGWDMWLFSTFHQTVPAALAEERAKNQRQKWLEPKKSKKRSK